MKKHSEMTWKELNDAIAENEPGTPAHDSAKEERAYRLKRYGIILLGGGILVAAAIKIF